MLHLCGKKEKTIPFIEQVVATKVAYLINARGGFW